MTNTIKLEPMNDKILILPESIKDKNIGGIIIPQASKDKATIGVVVAIGSDKELNKNIQVGDRVYYNKYSGTEIEIEQIKYLLIPIKEILARFI